MTIKRMTFAMLILIIIAGLFLVKFSDFRFSLYKNLMDEHDRILSEIDQLEPIEMSEDTVGTTPVHRGKVIVTSADGYQKEIRYYDSSDCIAIDYLGEGKEVIRRDLLYEDHVRVRIFYDSNKDRLYRHFLNEDEEIIDTESYFVPFGAGRATY